MMTMMAMLLGCFSLREAPAETTISRRIETTCHDRKIADFYPQKCSFQNLNLTPLTVASLQALLISLAATFGPQK